MAETVAQRVYLVRLALGDGVREPMRGADFAARLSAASGRKYTANTVSEMETEKRRVTLDDVDVIARLDPKQRGREWLAWGDGSGRIHLPRGSATSLEELEEIEREAAATKRPKAG